MLTKRNSFCEFRLPIPRRPKFAASSSRRVGRNEQKNQKAAGTLSPPPPPPPLAEARHPIATPRLAGAIILAIAALAIAAAAAAINAQFGWTLGETAVTAATFTALSVVVDLLAAALPPAAMALWRTRQLGLAIATLAVWWVAMFLATLATLGFFQNNLADAAASRATTVTMATASEDRRSEVIAAAKLAVSVAKASREAECSTRGPRCLQREVDERMAVSALSAAVASPVVSPATISDPDPQIAAVALHGSFGLQLRPDSAYQAWSLILNSGGLVLAIAFGLARPIEVVSGEPPAPDTLDQELADFEARHVKSPPRARPTGTHGAAALALVANPAPLNSSPATTRR